MPPISSNRTYEVLKDACGAGKLKVVFPSNRTYEVLKAERLHYAGRPARNFESHL